MPPCRRTPSRIALCLLAALAASRPASAQWLADGRAALGSSADVGSAERRLEASARRDWSWLSLRAAGVAARGDARAVRPGTDRWRGGGELSAALWAPRLGPLRAFATGDVERGTAAPAATSAAASLGLRLSPAHGAWGSWARAEASLPASLAAGTSPAHDTTSGRGGTAREQALDVAPRVRAAELGVWRAQGPLLLHAAARTGVAERRFARVAMVWHHVWWPDSSGHRPDSLGAVPDSTATTTLLRERMRQRWSSVEAGARWVHARVTLDAALGARPGLAGMRAGAWGNAGAAVSLGPRLVLRLAAGSAPDLPGASAPSRRFATVGLGVSTARFRETRPHPAVRGAVTAFALRAADDGRWTLAVAAPHARVVELAGDFTDWRPVALERTARGVWEATFAIAPGTHRVNLRVDGERWLAPPGLATVEDDFAGRVGLLLVP